ncbi:MAG: type VI secretion system baseplate subunit TssF [Paracoccus sp. (in: a-proteobacteria)]|uniref:type VI secretion system baseplate subunit TssF n=1 Tax=Paracoccus sp. TaxID=267 RepID=UPI0026DFCDB1|nr:type VI secretion system baseplate subunit TssF [Paracoccus sp. (in: a-proteobacteria)]MDO5622771.1 type VI secretion system baseplate subunit TssF [Paracoccus sp. (in: a-proteobacteria)]
MKKSFRDAYERELAILYEHSAEFAREFPGLADRLGGLLRENIDPAVAGLLEGTAFLAARVQLKLDEEFRGFTMELLEQIFPDALAPVPSCLLVEAAIPEANQEGGTVRDLPRGAYLDAPFRDAGRRVLCRFRLAAPLAVVPWRIGAIAYHDRTAAIGALGRDVAQGTRAGLVVDMAPTFSSAGMSPPDTLTFHIASSMAEATALYEQIHCDLLRVSLRVLAPNGDPIFLPLRPDQIEQVGFDGDETLFDNDTRLFQGFALLRELFIFPRKFLGFRLRSVADHLRHIGARDFQIVFEFRRINDELTRQTGPRDLRLNCAPAINLFEEGSNSIRPNDKMHEYVVTPDASPMTHYEIQRILGVSASYSSSADKTEVFPLYAVPNGGMDPRKALYYTYRRKPRRMTESEQRLGFRADYRGTETFLSLYEPPDDENRGQAKRLHVRALCSNRHIPAALPLTDHDNFHMVEERDVFLTAVTAPTPPREPMTEVEKNGPHRVGQGDVYWRLISYLALNHFGLDDRSGRDAVASLREMLNLFADLSDSVTEAQIAGLLSMNIRPVTRSIRRPEGYFPARGLEIAITFDEAAFEGSGIILMAAILDRFLAEYASVNSFTQMVTISRQRGEIKRWPPRMGMGALL